MTAAVEYKSGRPVAEDWFAPLARFAAFAALAALAGNSSTLIVYGGSVDQPRTTTPGCAWRSMGQVLDRVFD